MDKLNSIPGAESFRAGGVDATVNGHKPTQETSGTPRAGKPETNGAATMLFMDTAAGAGEKARIIHDALASRGIRRAGRRPM